MKTKFIPLFLLVLLSATTSFAQFNYNYAEYDSVSLDGSNNLHRTLLVDGTTQAPYGIAQHQSTLYNVLSNTTQGTSAGGNYQGPVYDMTDYMHDEYDAVIGFNIGDNISINLEASISCTASELLVLDTGLVTDSVLAYTSIQHSYPAKPLQKACWISQFFDKIGNAGTSHRAEDVIYDNGQGNGGLKPAYGDPVYAMEAGTVSKVVSNAGPASVGFPQCQGLGYPGNRVNVRDSNGYTTVYYHVLPLSGITAGTPITQGQQIGTLDNSGCQSGPHLHVGRLDPNAHPVNFTIPCTNPLPKTNFSDLLVDDDDTDVP